MRSEAQRRADAAYDAKVRASGKYKNLTCKLLAEEAEAFRIQCSKDGTTPNAFLVAKIREYIK